MTGETYSAWCMKRKRQWARPPVRSICVHSLEIAIERIAALCRTIRTCTMLWKPGLRQLPGWWRMSTEASN